MGESAANAFEADVCPVPPFAIGRVEIDPRTPRLSYKICPLAAPITDVDPTLTDDAAAVGDAQVAFVPSVVRNFPA